MEVVRKTGLKAFHVIPEMKELMFGLPSFRTLSRLNATAWEFI